MLKFRKILIADEKRLFKSGQTLFWYAALFWLPFWSPCFNLCILISSDFDFFPFESILCSIAALSINIILNLFCGSRYIITNENLKIIRTVFFTKVDSYPLNSIQGHSLAESYSYRGIQSYLFKIKFDNKINKYRFVELSKKSIEEMKKIGIQKINSNTEKVYSYYVFSIYFTINMINALFIIYFLAVHFYGHSHS